MILQSVTALIITKCNNFFISKCDRYCKVGRLLQSAKEHTRTAVYATDIPGPAIIGLQTFTDWLEPIPTASRVEGWDSTWTSDLNTAIQTEHHVTPTLEEIVLRLTDTEVFSTREAECGYWDVQWYWQFHLLSSEIRQPFQMVRSARGVFQLGSISNGVTLTYFHPNKETILKLKGLGSTLTQDRKPFAFAIKALADVEARCANIEREFFAIVYGCETFYTYLWGRSLTVNTEPHHSLPTRQRNWSS